MKHIKLKDLLTEGKMGKDEINQSLKDVNTPKELNKLFVDMWNGDEHMNFHKLFHNVSDTKLEKSFFGAIKKELKRYPDGLI